MRAFIIGSDPYIFCLGFFSFLLGSALYGELLRLKQDSELSGFEKAALGAITPMLFVAALGGFNMFGLWWVIYISLGIAAASFIWDFVRRKRINSYKVSLGLTMAGVFALAWVRAGW